jgi:hypothetical protein
MRLTLRLLTLFVLLSLAAFTNLVTRTSMADDSDPCGCTAKYNNCITACRADDPGCSLNCTLANAACDKKCGGVAVVETDN